MSQVTYRRRAHTIACRVVCVTSFFGGGSPNQLGFGGGVGVAKYLLFILDRV